MDFAFQVDNTSGTLSSSYRSNHYHKWQDVMQNRSTVIRSCYSTGMLLHRGVYREKQGSKFTGSVWSEAMLLKYSAHWGTVWHNAVLTMGGTFYYFLCKITSWFVLAITWALFFFGAKNLFYSSTCRHHIAFSLTLLHTAINLLSNNHQALVDR